MPVCCCTMVLLCCVTLEYNSKLLRMVQAVVAIRFCPQLYCLRDTSQGHGDQDGQQHCPFQLPYRMVFAIATLDSIIIYDTQVAFSHSTACSHLLCTHCNSKLTGYCLILPSHLLFFGDMRIGCTISTSICTSNG